MDLPLKQPLRARVSPTFDFSHLSIHDYLSTPINTAQMAFRHAADPPPDDLSEIEIQRLWDLRDLKHNELFLVGHSREYSY
jgi:hypothetical protein